MVQTVRFHRKALLDLARGSWETAWLVAGRIGLDAVTLLLPHLKRPGARLFVLTSLDPGRLAEGKLDLGALQLLRSLPGCELRHLPDLAACVYAFGPAGGALVTGAQLTMEGLDGAYTHGALFEDPTETLSELAQWWERALPVDDDAWNHLVVETSQRLEARTLGDEIARVGGFVRVAMRGTRRTRRLDPREFGVPEGEWGRAVRPVEVALYKLDEVIRAKDDLDALLAENGLEWNGYYLVPRRFLEHEWPRLFANRERQLKERLNSPDGRAALKSQLSQARRELEAFFGELYPRADSQGMTSEVWIDMQATRVLTETVSSTFLEESGLEYRVLTILPEDPRSVEELQRLLQDPKLRSVQLTFHI
jgi:hypothetical protein